MSAQQSPFFGVNYGWALDEDGWNVGMDENLLNISALLYGAVDGVSNTTPSMGSGQMYYNSGDNTLNFSVDGAIHSIQVPIGFSFTDKSTGVSYVRKPTGLEVGFDLTAGDARYLKQSDTTPFSKSLLAAATAAASRGLLGLGTASTQATGYFEQAIVAGTTAQYYRGDKSFQDFATDVRAAVLTGFAATNSAVAATDSVLSAIGKLQGQLNSKANLASPSLTGTPTAPTAAAGTNTTQIATTAFVKAAVGSSGNYVSKTGDTMTGLLLAPSIRSPMFTDGGLFLQGAGGTGTISLDVSSYPAFQINVTGAGTLTLAPTNLPSGGALDSITIVVRIVQPTQPGTISWWSGISWLTSGGAAPASPAAGKIAEFVLTYYLTAVVGGNNWIGRIGATT